LFQEGFGDLGKRFRPCDALVAKRPQAQGPRAHRLNLAGFLLSGIGVKRMSEKNSRAAANQKRNNERHHHYSYTNDTFVTSFCFRLLRWGAEVVSSPWSFCGSGWRAIAGGGR
jgi:hypothetical protein